MLVLSLILLNSKLNSKSGMYLVIVYNGFRIISYVSTPGGQMYCLDEWCFNTKYFISCQFLASSI